MTPPCRGKDLDWFAKQTAKLDALERASVEERLDYLGRRVGGVGSNLDSGEEARLIFERACKMLYSTPGYADYYKAKLLAMKEAGIIDGNPDGPLDGPKYSAYLRERMYVFQTLRHVPTPETVAMLASLLDDEKPGGNGTGASMAVAASAVLCAIIDPPPVRGAFPHQWREWRDRVERGEETYSLKGSKQRYDFSGPVERRVPREPKDPGAISAVEEDEKPKRGRHWLPVGLGLGLLSAACLWYLKGRGRNRAGGAGDSR